MKLLFDFFPILLFFIGYKFLDVFAATLLCMLASIVQVGLFWIKHRKIEATHAITFVIIMLLGSITIFLHNTTFIKWKPTAVYWVFAILCIGSPFFFSKKPFIQHLMGDKIALPTKVWHKLNFSWATFFAIMGGLNLYVAYKFNMDTWVNFKLFGTLGCTLVFGLLQAIHISKYLKNDVDNSSQDITT